MSLEAPRKFYLRELTNEESEIRNKAQDSHENQELTETQQEIEKFIEKIKITLGEINIKLIGLGKSNNNLLKEINDWNNSNKNQKDVYIVTGNLIGICRKYMNDPNLTPILDQLQFCMNTLMNQYKVKGEIDGIAESIKSIGDTVGAIYRPEERGNNGRETSFGGRSVYPNQTI